MVTYDLSGLKGWTIDVDDDGTLVAIRVAATTGSAALFLPLGLQKLTKELLQIAGTTAQLREFIDGQPVFIDAPLIGDTLLKLTERYCVVYQTLRNPPALEISRKAI